MKNPVTQLRRFWQQAHRKKDLTADYFLLASVDRQKRPHVRTVLIKTLDRHGIGFVTNKTGPKNEQFQTSSMVEGCMVWPTLTLQVRIAGKVKPMPKKIVKKLWARRPREAKLLYHLGLKQSSPIPSYKFLLESVANLEKKWRNKKQISLAPNYIGYIVEPTIIELLHHNPSRLNKRELYHKTKRGWAKSFLAP